MTECPSTPLKIPCVCSAATWIKLRTRTCKYFGQHNAYRKGDNSGITSLNWIQIEIKYIQKKKKPRWFWTKWAWQHRPDWTCKKYFNMIALPQALADWKTSHDKTHEQNVIQHIQHDLNMLTPVWVHVLPFKLKWLGKSVISHQKYDILRNSYIRKAIKI